MAAAGTGAAVDVVALRRRIAVCMFDQYGTVVDMQGGLRAAAADYLRDKGWSGDADGFVTWWRRTHFENSMIDALLQRGHTPYRRIGELSLGHVLTRAGIPHTAEEVRQLVGRIESLPCFPEVPAAMRRLRARFRLAVLSNGDPDMLQAALPHHGIAFDALISAAEADAFKPHRATYEHAARRMDVAPDQVLFIANHEFDCVGAKAAGMATAFINRRGRPFADWPYQPDLTVPDMGALADLLV